MILNPILTRLTLLHAVVLFAVAGCKPAPPPSGGEATPQPQGGTTLRHPTTDDLKAFLQTLFPPAIKLAEVRTDVPTRVPNTAPADNTWLINAKLTLTPTEDLLSLPPQQDADAINALVNELSGLVAWRVVGGHVLFGLVGVVGR